CSSISSGSCATSTASSLSPPTRSRAAWSIAASSRWGSVDAVCRAWLSRPVHYGGNHVNATAQNTGPLGEERGVGFAIVMSIVTIGIYFIYWIYKSYSEVKRHRGEGMGGLVGFLSCFIFLGYFKLPQYVGRMYRAEGNQNPPVSGITGLWYFVP